jgi:hypothetical protein
MRPSPGHKNRGGHLAQTVGRARRLAILACSGSASAQGTVKIGLVMSYTGQFAI